MILIKVTPKQDDIFIVGPLGLAVHMTAITLEVEVVMVPTPATALEMYELAMQVNALGFGWAGDLLLREAIRLAEKELNEWFTAAALDMGDLDEAFQLPPDLEEIYGRPQPQVSRRATNPGYGGFADMFDEIFGSADAFRYRGGLDAGQDPFVDDRPFNHRDFGRGLGLDHEGSRHFGADLAARLANHVGSFGNGHYRGHQPHR